VLRARGRGRRWTISRLRPRTPAPARPGDLTGESLVARGERTVATGGAARRSVAADRPVLTPAASRQRQALAASGDGKLPLPRCEEHGRRDGPAGECRLRGRRRRRPRLQLTPDPRLPGRSCARSRQDRRPRPRPRRLRRPVNRLASGVAGRVSTNSTAAACDTRSAARARRAGAYSMTRSWSRGLDHPAAAIAVDLQRPGLRPGRQAAHPPAGRRRLGEREHERGVGTFHVHPVARGVVLRPAEARYRSAREVGGEEDHRLVRDRTQREAAVVDPGRTFVASAYR